MTASRRQHHPATRFRRVQRRAAYATGPPAAWFRPAGRSRDKEGGSRGDAIAGRYAPGTVHIADEGTRGITQVRHIQPGKARFDDIYDRPDPRAYYQQLEEIGYELPGLAQPVFATLLAERREQTAKEHLVVTDVCCSYGVNAAMMNHDLGLDDLFEHYGDPDLDGCSREEILDADARFFTERRRSAPTDVVGIDIAANAVSYGVEAGLLDHGVAANLEDEAPSAAARDAIAETDLVTVTGGVGYITEKTFDRIIGAVDTTDTAETKPWVAAFALRWVDYEPVADVLAAAGLETEHVEGRVFRQRRFRDDAEREYTLRELRERGVDPSGVEDAGWFYANLFVSRPPEHVRARPASELLADAR